MSENTTSIKGLIRETLRGILKAWGMEATDEQLKKLVRKALPMEVSDEAYSDAREWNQSQGYIRYRYDEEDEVDLWKITERGITKVLQDEAPKG